MHGEVWALIDCNNFFVSCERAFRPDLWERPVLVLSSNDGCVVSRSKEVKMMGIPMGEAKFKIQEIIDKGKVECFSSNFRLYGDMSNRVMTAIKDEVGPMNQEIYSIDECFIRGNGLRVKNWTKWGKELRDKLKYEVGIPVTIGIAPTKTLAKLVAELAKKDFLGEGVVYLDRDEFQSQSWQRQQIQEVALDEVWGIGRRIAKKLYGMSIFTVGDFMKKEKGWVRKNFGLMTERTWRELHGESCIENLEAAVEDKQILRSRSFGSGVKEKAELGRAIAEYMTVAVENLRRQRLRARLVTVFIRTSRFVEKEQTYNGSLTLSLTESTSYLPDLISSAEKILEKIYRKGFIYKKAGVILSGLEREGYWQLSLEGADKKGEAGVTEIGGEWGETATKIDEEKKQLVMKSIDKLNRRYGGRKVNVGRIAGQGKNYQGVVVESWRTRADSRSPEYTTNWEELRQVN